jgi:hypothetical protein
MFVLMAEALPVKIAGLFTKKLTGNASVLVLNGKPVLHVAMVLNCQPPMI